MIFFRNVVLFFTLILIWVCIELHRIQNGGEESLTFDCDCGIKKSFSGGFYGLHKDDV